MLFKEYLFNIFVIPHLGPLENNIYFIFDKKTKQVAVVDPAWDCDLIINTAKTYGYKITDILLTHWHDDHINAADMLVKQTNAKIYADSYEIPQLKKIKSDIIALNDGDIIYIGNTKVKIIHTPGHTIGSCCYLLDKHLISGDTLFIYGAGHCINGDSEKLYHSMQKLKNIDSNTLIHCGHDYGDKFYTNMNEQINHNPFMLIDDIDDFIKYRDNIHDKSRNYPMQAMKKEQIQQIIKNNQ